ncbi:hypothetical protein EI94DRAFT_1727689 [Lactarius quietus]|nr:hypothetical protein EI94DRAFT_1727689 [Lactarius quietus]
MQAFVLSVVARAQRRDGHWFATASDEIGVRESVLRNHATHGDNLSLAILIHVTRQQFSRFEELYWPWPQVSKVIKAASNFNAQDTSPELQHEFCALWNQIVLDVQGDNKMCLAFFVLRRIRNVYVALHQGTDAAPTLFSASTDDEDRILWDPSAYPLCNIPTHHPYSNAHVPASTAIPRTVMCSSALIPAPISSTGDAASPPILARVHTDENSIVAPLFNNNMSAPASFHAAHWTAAGGLRDSATSPDPAIASTVREIETSTRSMPPTTDEASISPSSIPLTGAGSDKNNADLAHSDAADAPSSAVLELELKPDDTLLTVSHLSIPASTSFGTSPWPSAPELSAVASDKGTDSREDRVALDPPSVNRAIQANTMAILDPLLQPPSQPSATDLAIASPSLREPNAEHTGDHPPYTSHGQYDIV